MKKRFLPESLLPVAIALFMAAVVAIRVQAAGKWHTQAVHEPPVVNTEDR